MLISKEELKKLYYEKKLTQQEIADKFSITQATVQNYMAKYGLKVRNGKWTSKELELLIEKYGEINLKTICEKLNRPALGVKKKAGRLKLGGALQASEFITKEELARALSVDSRAVKNWIDKYGLKAKRRILVEKAKYYRISLSAFWEWAEKNAEKIRWDRVEPGILGIEPKWVKEKRNECFKMPKKSCKYWTKQEEEYLKMYWGTDRTVEEIAKILGRTGAAIIKKASKLNLKKRSIPIKWKQTEIKMLIDMKKQGKTDNEVAEELGRSCGSVTWKRRKLSCEG